MKYFPFKNRIVVFMMIGGLLVPLSLALIAGEGEPTILLSLLPEDQEWEMTQDPDIYLPENLFEYINGAAEAYLSYGFEELAVAEFNRAGSDAVVLVEIYDMGSTENTFGIYGAERYIDNRFIPVGIQGYIEADSLNFFTGNYYIKLLCFDCSRDSEEILMTFAGQIVDKVKEPGRLPPLLSSFPSKGKVDNSEKFILRNVLGYSFLEKGYFVDYQVEGMEFDCFVIRAESGEEAEKMLAQYIERKKELEVNKMDPGYHIKDRYYANIYTARIGRYVCGVMKIPDGSEELGLNYLNALIENLEETSAAKNERSLTEE